MSENEQPQLYDRIHAQRASLSPNHERVARFLLDHPLDTALLTATELAQKVNVDPATVVRFAQKLGYDGYLTLKAELGQLVRNNDVKPSAPTGNLGQALHDAHQRLTSEFNMLWESIDGSELIQVVELFGMPYHLLLLSDSSCNLTAEWLAIELRERGFRIDKPGEDPEAIAESMLSLGDYDRALILEGTTPSPALEHLSQELQRKKIRSLGILGSSTSQVAHYVDSAIQLPPVGDPGIYPVMLQQLLTTTLQAVRQLQEAYQSEGEQKVDIEGNDMQAGNRL